MFLEDAPLATFAARIRIGYALGIYGPKTRDDLTFIRHVRNVFAHTRHAVDFDTKEISDASNQISLADRCGLARLLPGRADTPRAKYINAAKVLSVYLFTPEPGTPLRYTTVTPDSWREEMS
jgi:DNA-binding MltR family transcriptional regulator